MTDTINKELEKQLKREQQKKYYEKNKEQIIQRAEQHKKEYYLKNKDKILEQKKKTRLENIQTYRARESEYQKKYHELNPDKKKQYWDNYYERNKEEIIKKNTLRTLDNKVNAIEKDLKLKLPFSDEDIDKEMVKIRELLLSRLFVRKYNTKNIKQNKNENDTTTAESGDN